VPKRLTPDVEYRRTILEGDLQKSIIEYAEAMGWEVVHINDSRRQKATGLPDLLMIRAPRMVWAELKREPGAGGNKNAPTTHQVWWMNELKLSGQEVHLWRPSDWLDGLIDPVLE